MILLLFLAILSLLFLAHGMSSPPPPNQQKQKLGFFTYIFCAPNSFFPNSITKLHLFHNLKKKIVSGQ